MEINPTKLMAVLSLMALLVFLGVMANFFMFQKVQEEVKPVLKTVTVVVTPTDEPTATPTATFKNQGLKVLPTATRTK